SDGSLVSRREQGAVIRDHNIAAKRVLKMVKEGKVMSKDGGEIELHADTICVHGDNPEAVALVKNIREELVSSKIDIAPMGTFL
ncbi:MAG: LamB/YcsF family protein, partial [Deltaproteobacteria bacterium]|nr:LamB/YcsF family protein [Deltaproteobacteria bacterium]MBW2114416.1 LamB/YcsF family protein [Deltaproteobacteria bacterium]